MHRPLGAVSGCDKAPPSTRKTSFLEADAARTYGGRVLGETLVSKRLDAKDHALLGLLRRNARTPVVALAKALGLSRSATQERLQRLETSGAIQGYTIRTRLDGSPAVLAWMRLKLAPGVACADVVPAVLARPEIRLCHSLAGPTDLLLLVELATLEALSASRDALSGLGGVAEVETAPVMGIHLNPPWA
jgi:DNA-binding Lrp family transcriptional regulator